MAGNSFSDDGGGRERASRSDALAQAREIFGVGAGGPVKKEVAKRGRRAKRVVLEDGDLPPLMEPDAAAERRWDEAPDSAAAAGYVRDLEFVADHIKSANPQLERCPSRSAWRMLGWAREFPVKFWEVFNRVREREYARADGDDEQSERLRTDRDLRRTVGRLIEIARDSVSGLGAARPFGQSAVSPKRN